MKTIIALDDDSEILKCLKLALEQRGYQAFTATNFDDFVRLIKEHAPDLVLLDVRMPNKNGFEVFKQLRQWQTVPVLFVTAYSGSFTLESKNVLDLWQNQFSDGRTDILYKPFNIKVLYEKVESLIGPPETSK